MDFWWFKRTNTTVTRSTLLTRHAVRHWGITYYTLHTLHSRGFIRVAKSWPMYVLLHWSTGFQVSSVCISIKFWRREKAAKSKFHNIFNIFKAPFFLKLLRADFNEERMELSVYFWLIWADHWLDTTAPLPRVHSPKYARVLHFSPRAHITDAPNLYCYIDTILFFRRVSW